MSALGGWRLAVAVPLCMALAGCGEGGSSSSPSSEEGGSNVLRNPGAGVTARIPVGWHQVPPIDLPGAKIPLQVASFRANGGVRSICIPHHIVDQIPPGGALVQLLDDGVETSAKQFPPLRMPFRLGPLRGHECGEAYNVAFGEAGRAFQLRVWTAPTGPNRSVRDQIENLLDSLRVR